MVKHPSAKYFAAFSLYFAEAAFTGALHNSVMTLGDRQQVRERRRVGE